MKKKGILVSILMLASLQAMPQRSVTDLNGTWEFDRTEKAFPPATFSRTIPVPGLIHLAEPEIDDYDVWFKKPLEPETKQAHGVYDIDYTPKYNWYRRVVQIDEDQAELEFLLRIKKSQYVTQVFVNGIDMGTSMECYTPIEIPITRALRFGEENEILVRVGDRYWLPPQAAGSTDKEKEHYLPGIWDDVELIAAGKVQVNNTLFLPDAAGGRVTAKIRLRSFYPQQIMYGDPKSDAVTVRVEIFEKATGNKVGGESWQVEARREHLTVTEMEIGIDNPHLWSPGDPFLYQARTTVLMDDRAIDMQEERFGLRDFERRGKYFYLNGEKILLRGTNITLQRFFRGS